MQQFISILIGCLTLYNGVSYSQKYVVKDGEKPKRFDLPDGNSVWLKAGSSIDYVNSPSHPQAKLVGEAFFRCSKPWNRMFAIIVDGNKHFEVMPQGSVFISSRLNTNRSRITTFEAGARARAHDSTLVLTPRKTISIDSVNILNLPYSAKIDTAFLANLPWPTRTP